MGFEPIKRLLPQALQSAGIERQITAMRIIQTTQDAILRLWGEDKAQYVQIVSFANGIIKITSNAPSALQELKIWEVNLMNEINRTLQTRVVFGFRFV